MGSSFIDFKGYGFWARDTHIDLWLYLLVREIDKLESRADWLEAAREHWLEQATVSFVGLVQPQLDEYLTSQERVDLVIHLSERVLNLLYEKGGHVSGEYLNARGIGGGGYRPATTWEMENFVGVGRKFVELLKGEVRTSASTSPVF
jgi:hypothetical protein